MSNSQHPDLYCLDPQQLASNLATIIATAEQPCSLIPREGNRIRLVSPHERLTQAQMQQQLCCVMLQPEMAELLQEQCHNLTLKRPPRHVTAWLRGCCYLSVGNFNQALRDARTALAYAAEAAGTAAQRGTIKAYINPQRKDTTCSNTPTHLHNGISRGLMPVTAAAPSLQPQANQQTSHTAFHPCPTQLDELPLDAERSQVVSGPQRTRKHLTPPWFPAALLAGQAYAELGDSAQAVLHLAQALASAPAYASAVVHTALQQAVRTLPPDQAFAWATGGCEGLQQQLRDEADQKLPEVLRPRPKWYYYNQWTRQRIHLTLLELQLGSLSSQDTALLPSLPCSTTTTTNNNHNNSSTIFSTSTSSTRGRLLLGLLSTGRDNTPLVTAAAAAAGFQVGCNSGSDTAPAGAHLSSMNGAASLCLTAPTPGVPSQPSPATTPPDTTLPASRLKSDPSQSFSSIAVAQTARGLTPEVTTANSSAHISELCPTDAPSAPASQVSRQCDRHLSTGQRQQNSSTSTSRKALQLPEAVVSKLLSMDAGDLDLMLQHPCALQAQVYELLDVLQVEGVEGLEAHPLQPLTWEEVQLLSGPGTVGLPLGYSPLQTLMPPPISSSVATSKALLPAPRHPQQRLLLGDTPHNSGTMDAVVSLGPETGGAHGPLYNEGSRVGGVGGWRRPGWSRVQYIKHAASASAATAAVCDVVSSGHTTQAEGAG